MAWLSFKHPDSPDNVQLRALQQMLRTILEGRVLELFSEEDWKGFATGVDSSKKALLAAGAKHDALNHREEAPLSLCTRPFTLFGSEAGKREIVQLLVEAGAKAGASGSG